jgi:imidazolonepropionase-like amidohydrolase
MVSTTVADWNDMFSVESLEASQAYADALAEQASWAEEIPNPTYDAEIPYADFVLDLEQASANLTLPETDVIRGIHLTLDGTSVWNVTGESQLVSLTMEEGAAIIGNVDIYVNCDGFDTANGQLVEDLTAGTYENVVIVPRAEDDLVQVLVLDGEAYVNLSDLLGFNSGVEDIALTDDPTIVLKGATLLDAQHNGVVLDVLVQNGIIVDVGPDLTGDETIDLTGYTLMPGLIDSHVHVASSSGYNMELLETWAQHGITSVREEGMLSTSGEMEDVDLIEQANADPASAYLVATGKYLDVTGGYGMGPTGNMGVVITTPEEAAQEITVKAELGYSQVKVGINSDEDRMTAEEFQAIVDTAHANGMTVAAHVNYADHLAELVGYGIDESAHTPSDEMSGELISGMVQAGVSMNTSGAESYEDVKIQNLQAFAQAGGVITVGTDLMRGYDGCMESLVSEMAVLAKAGLSVQQVIACATHNNAQAMGLNTGDIAVGREADLVAVQGTVDDTFAALNDISFVMNDGVVIVNN